MGEYATYKGNSIKIGTCENMYYLRADQADLVTPESGSVDPFADRAEIRFRFPWPDEDHVEPGQFEDYDRSLAVACPTPPELDHHEIVMWSEYPHKGQFSLSVPCPASGELKIPFRLIGHAETRLVQQRWWDGHLAVVCECGYCGARYRLPSLEDALDLIEALRDSGQNEIADRVTAGYMTSLSATV